VGYPWILKKYVGIQITDTCTYAYETDIYPAGRIRGATVCTLPGLLTS